MEHKYSVKKIIIYDLFAFWAFIVLMIAILLEIRFGYILFLQITSEPQIIPVENIKYCIFIGIAALIVMICFIERMNTIKSYFNTGTEVKGKIIGLRSDKLYIHITYDYSIKEQYYKRELSTLMTKTTSNLKNYSEIKVLVKPENYSKAIIKDIFMVTSNT